MKLNPHLRFNDNKAREALDFYKDCFPGAKVEIQTVADSPMAKEFDAAGQNKIMHSTFTVGDIVFTASDMMRDRTVSSDQISLMVTCDNEAELRALFDKLAVGGEVFMPVDHVFWGAIFGMVTDKYGIEWNLNFFTTK